MTDNPLSMIAKKGKNQKLPKQWKQVAIDKLSRVSLLSEILQREPERAQ